MLGHEAGTGIVDQLSHAGTFVAGFVAGAVAVIAIVRNILRSRGE